MESLIQNQINVYKAIAASVKHSFINMESKVKWYNHKDNLSFMATIGSVRSSIKNTGFREGEVEACIAAVEKAVGSYEMTKHKVMQLTDKKSGNTFECLQMWFKPIDIPN